MSEETKAQQPDSPELKLAKTILTKTAQKKLIWTETPEGFQTVLDNGFSAAFTGMSRQSWVSFQVNAGDKVLYTYVNPAGPFTPLAPVKDPVYPTINTLHRIVGVQFKNRNIKSALELLNDV